MKEGNVIIPISKQEALHFEKLGYMYHKAKYSPEADLCKSKNTRHPKYYLAPKKKSINALEELRGCKIQR